MNIKTKLVAQHIAELLKATELLIQTEAERIFNPLGESDEKNNKICDKFDLATAEIQKARAILESIAEK